ncbi:MAG TPA: bifunctional 4-hydroxy-2-oxoglutarate aldolase/2-dehydro-3-deoxy-phosphogluconate aldolase [Candidatus Acidoferrum sp.]|nr:bifunctional 4-hydroxy-2-oxoglutarate aldolase/2-dehydro-3-deoxy-phosphogluconate aldolase [Candidatus Acidoferrum sp.]
MSEAAKSMTKQEVRALIEKVGIVPVIRAASAEEARFAADCVRKGGVPIVEITMTVPGAVEVIREVARTMPEVLVGAGTVLSAEAATKCIDAGAQFLVTPGFNAATVAATRARDVLIVAGALTPSEIMEASAAGADFVKVFPCGSMGGPKYLQALRGPFPSVAFVPTGGVNLETAGEYIRAGAAALGVGGEMVLKDALRARDGDAISKMAALFVDLVRDARGAKG